MKASFATVRTGAGKKKPGGRLRPLAEVKYEKPPSRAVRGLVREKRNPCGRLRPLAEVKYEKPPSRAVRGLVREKRNPCGRLRPLAEVKYEKPPSRAVRGLVREKRNPCGKKETAKPPCQIRTRTDKPGYQPGNSIMS